MQKWKIVGTSCKFWEIVFFLIYVAAVLTFDPYHLVLWFCMVYTLLLLPLSKFWLDSRYFFERRISCDVFVLIFLLDGLIFWRRKKWAVNEKTQRIKKEKESKKENNCLCYFNMLSKNTFCTRIICQDYILEYLCTL